MNEWKIDDSRTDTPEGFPYAIVMSKKKVIAWVANRRDAEFIVSAAAKIRGLASESSRHRALWFGSLIRRRSR